MKSNAKITRDSLKTYTDAVKQIVDYSSTATETASDFDDLIAAIGDEIAKLEEKKRQLNEAKIVVRNKIVEYETKIKETQLRILEKEKELASIRAEMAVTPKTITYVDSKGICHTRPNSQYISLVNIASADQGDLSKLYSELHRLEHCLNKCRSVEKELSSVFVAVQNRVANLNNNKLHVKKNKSEYSSTVASVRNHSSNAFSKLAMITKTLDNYLAAQLKVVPAYEAAQRDVGSRQLSDLEYMTPKFQNASSGVNETGKNFYDDEGKLYKNSEGLVPNSTFKLNNYTFTSDSFGRPAGASGKLRLAEEKKDRNWDSTLGEMGQGDERPGDNRGHSIGHQFDGPDSIVNAFPQDEKINKGEYKAFENYLASELRSGNEVFVNISPIYKGDSRRPVGVAISYSIDGVRRMRYFDNESKDG